MQQAKKITTLVRAPFSGVIRDLADVPDAAFADGMLGGGIAIEPLDPVVVAPFDGVVVAIAPTGHSVTLRSHENVEILIHIGIDTVALNHAGFDVVAVEGQHVSAGTPLIRLDLDIIAAQARDCVTPIVILSEHAEIRDMRPTGPVQAGDALFSVTLGNVIEETGDDVARTTAHLSVTIGLPHGIHARPAAAISRFARSQNAKITLSFSGKAADAASTTEMMMLGVGHGDEVAIRALGVEARVAAIGLVELLDQMAKAELETHQAPTPAPPEPTELLTETQRRGVRASPGLACGPATQLRATDLELPTQYLGEQAERAALAKGIATLKKGIEQAKAGGGNVADQIAEAHLAVLDDIALLAEADRLIATGQNAPAAWRAASRIQESGLADLGNDRLRERMIDFRDVERRLISVLLGGPANGSAAPIPKGAVLICDDIQPSLLMESGKSDIAAICCVGGGATSHAAILAAAAGIPMIVSLGADILLVADQTIVIVDADNAVIDLRPTPKALGAFEERTRVAMAQEKLAAERASEDCYLADGQRIKIFANLTSVEDALRAVAQGAEGCGLLRTEFLFAERTDVPTEEEQLDVLSAIASALGPRPLIVRTLDVGGDKPLPYFPFEPEENPALGMRGVRFTLRHKDVLRNQLRAMLRAIPPESLNIMVPMIVDAGELAAVRAMLNDLTRELGITQPIPLGIMVETPAAVLLSDQLAAEADFLSIGSNDLSQYVLAMDRGNAGLADRVDACHPAVLRAIHQTALGASGYGRWMGICGGLASEPNAAPLLVGLGCVELSAVPRAIPAIKQALRQWTHEECITLAQSALQQQSAEAVRQLLAGAAK